MIAGIAQPFLNEAKNRNLIVRGSILVEGNQLVFHRDPGVLDEKQMLTETVV